MYVESSYPFVEGQAAMLASSFLVSYFNCLTFYFHMWGEHMGTLQVYVVNSDGNFQMVWSATGNHGNKWNKAQVKINSIITFKVS